MKVFEVSIKAGIVGMFHEPQSKFRAKSEQEAVDKQWNKSEAFYKKHGIEKHMLFAEEVKIED